MMRAESMRSTVRGAARLVAALLAAGAATPGCAAPRPADTLVLASGSDLESANPVVTVHPMSRQVQRHVLFLPLVHLDEALRPVPALARAWTWSPDRRVLTFRLRTDVHWHDGVRTTARDARFTFEAVQDPATGSPRAGDLRGVSSLEVPDDSTFIVRFREAPPTLPLVFAEVPPVPEHHLRHVPRAQWRAAPFSTAPVGNGPFRFRDRTPGVRWRFERNAAHPLALGGPPWARLLVVTVVDEASTKLAGLVSGDLDVAGVSPATAALVRRDPLLVLETPPVLFTTFLVFNTTRPPFDDPRVRRAVALAIDRRRLVDAAVAGFGVPSRQLVPPGVFVPETTAAAPTAALREQLTDTAAAARLLDDAGWRRDADGWRHRAGRPLALALLTAGSGELAAEQLLQADLRALGMALTLQPLELATFLATLRADEKRFDLAFTGVPGDLALGHLRALLHGDQRGGALAYTGHASPSLDAALDAAATAGTRPDQRAAWHRVDTLVAREAPVTVLYHARGVQGRARALRGVAMDLRGELATVARWSRDPVVP
jgi:peptide/nickel transport system substrate-binding protein